MNSRTYSRSETTAMLSELVEKRLESHTSYWAREVSFDRGTPMWRRIDYVGFKPFTPNYAVEPVSVAEYKEKHKAFDHTGVTPAKYQNNAASGIPTGWHEEVRD